MCLYPRLIQNKKYTKNKKNGGEIPAVSDKRVLAVPIGCGKCMECKSKKGREWKVRLSEDIKVNKNAKFVTLTFSNQSIKDLSKDIILKGYDKGNEICRIAVRRFVERWRKVFKKSVRHWLVTEIGGSRYEIIHLHGILWTKESKETIDRFWKYGMTYTGEYVNEETIGYITKYVTKTDFNNKFYNSKIFSSAGIGKNYINSINARNNKYTGEKTDEAYRTKTGFKLALPIYYRNKLYSDEERENLWLNKLDKEERFVGGELIDISKGMEEYWKTLEFYRNKNKRLGYGDSEKDWSREIYERFVS